MYRVDDPSAVASRPAPTALGTEGWHLRGVAGGAQGTVVTAEHKNMVQAEMEAIRALNPSDPGSDKTVDTQLADAILARIHAETGPVCSGFHTVWDDPDKITTGPGRCASDISSSFISVAGSEQKDATVAWSQGGIGGAPAGLPGLGQGQRLPFFVGWNDDASPLITHGWDIEANAETAALLVADTGYANWKRIGWHVVGTDAGFLNPGIMRYFQDPADPTRWMYNLEQGFGPGLSQYDGPPQSGFSEIVDDDKVYDIEMNWSPPNCVVDYIVQLLISDDVPVGQHVHATIMDSRMWPVGGTDYGEQYWRASLTGVASGLALESTYGSIQLAHGGVPEVSVSTNFATGAGFEITLTFYTRGWIDTRGIHK